MVDSPERPSAGYAWKKAWVLALAVTPLLIQSALKTRLWPRPFWIHFYDPETIYFYEGLRLLQGLAPRNVDNPGTPLQMVSAGIALVTGRGPQHYESFLLVAHSLVGLSLVAGALLLLTTVFRETPLPVQLVAVWTWAAVPGSLDRVDVWSPESFYFFAGSVVLALLWKYLRTPKTVWAVTLGVACGFAMALKIVMIGVAAGAVVAVLVRRNRIHTFATGVSAIIGFAIATLPAAPRWPFMASRILALTGDPDWNQSTWPELLVGWKGWLLWLIVVLIFSARGYRCHPELAAFGFAVIVVTVLGNLSSPSPRHLLPHGVGVLALLAAGSPFWEVFRARRLAFGAMCLLGLLTVKTMGNDLATHRKRISGGVRLRQEIHAALPKGAAVLWSWRVPEPSFALRVMAASRADEAAVARMYPRHGFYDVWNRRVEPPLLQDWDTLVIRRKDLADFPLPVGATLAELNGYLIVAREAEE